MKTGKSGNPPGTPHHQFKLIIQICVYNFSLHASLPNPDAIDWSSIDTVLFDCDGVIVHGDESPIPNSITAVNVIMNELGKRVYFVSNNSSKDRSDFVKLFEGLGVMGCKEEQIICTSWLAIEEVKKCRSVYVIGSEALVKCLMT